MNIRNPIHLTKAVYAYVTLARDLNKLGQVFELRSAIESRETQDRMIAHFSKDPEGARALVERPRIGQLNMESLLALPEGSLGSAYARHMREAGLDPAAIPELPSPDTWSYPTAHLYETHDLWHVVTGFGTDVVGELGLQAFYLAQFPANLAAGLLSVGFLNTMIFSMDERTRRMDAITEGWAMGRAARQLFGYPWARRLDAPLCEVRVELGIERPARGSA